MEAFRGGFWSLIKLGEWKGVGLKGKFEKEEIL